MVGVPVDERVGKGIAEAKEDELDGTFRWCRSERFARPGAFCDHHTDL